ncbi:MAG: DUF1329 domain-containing protein, partial [Thermodesulfobacteriota bacterium]|nr:DUF1329 domain-containing protein [Thermodesulfobacteriota bacterium]
MKRVLFTATCLITVLSLFVTLSKGGEIIDLHSEAYKLKFPSKDIEQKEIKAGITITKDNYQNYLQSLKEYLGAAAYITVVDGLVRGAFTVPVVKTRNYPQPVERYRATMKNKGKARVGKDNSLIGWVSGQPFPEPKKGAEAAWNYDRRNMVTDQFTFWADYLLFAKGGEKEREFRWLYHNYYYNGRLMVKPIPEVLENNGKIRMKESFVITEPYDIKSFAMIRTRYEAIDKFDAVYSYIPAIRRLRRLTGADLTDPLFGSDQAYDEFELCRQKITPDMTFSLQEKDVLVPTHLVSKKVSYSREDILPVVKGNCVQWDWEIRPVSILGITVNNPDYPISRRVIYMEKIRQTGVGFSTEIYDQRGRLWKGQSMIVNAMMDGPTYANIGWMIGRYDTLLKGHST